MKQFAALALVLLAFTFSANAQCTPNTNITTPGFYPSGDSLPCVERSVYYDTTIQIKNYTTIDPADFGVSGFPPIAISWIRIDNISGLPAGLTYTCSPSNCQFSAGANGCVNVTGTTTAPVGTYPLIIEATISALGQTFNGTSDMLGFEFILNVIDSGAPCPSPLVSLLNGPLFACPGAPAQILLDIDTGGGVAPFTYAWSPATGLSDPNIANPVASVTAATTYTVTVTDANGYEFTTTVDVDVDNTPTPVADFNFAITGGNTVEFTNLSSNGTNVSWYFGNGNTSSAANPDQVFDSITDYTVTLIVRNNCGADTVVKTLSITSITDVKGRDLKVDVFPNPTKGMFSVSLNGTTAVQTEVAVYDMQGRRVKTGIMQNNGATMSSIIDLSSNGSGIYIVKVVSGTQTSTHKLVVQ